MTRAALGIRVKSGRAIAVVVTGSAASLELRVRSLLDLSDPTDPSTVQPYHADFGRLEENERVLQARVARVRRAARASVASLVRECRALDASLVAACLVVGSTIDPESIANPHIRAHAFEGRLFRTVVEEALANAGITSQVLLERDAYGTATAVLRRSEADLKATLTAIGKGKGGPWRADEKLAALAAWMILARRD